MRNNVYTICELYVHFRGNQLNQNTHFFIHSPTSSQRTPLLTYSQIKRIWKPQHVLEMETDSVTS